MTTNYTYDLLNRLTTKTYSESTPGSYYTYDSFTGWGQPHGASIGRLVRSYECGLAGCEDDLFSYDPVGRINHIEGATPSEAGHASHWTAMYYDLAGNPTLLQYPSGRIVTQGFDGAGRLNSVGNVTGYTSFGSFGGLQTQSSPYVSNISYSPAGTPKTVQYGNGLSENIAQNNRLQTCESNAFLPTSIGGQMIMDRQYFLSSSTGTPCGVAGGNNGNIWSIADATNTVQGSGQRSQNFTYDALNRLHTWNTNFMAGGSRSQTFNYDSFGNIYQAAGYNMQDSPLGFDPINNPAYDANNRLVGSSFNCSPAPGTVGLTSNNPGYDAAGNVLCSGNRTFNAQAYLYDAESRLFQSQNELNSPMGSYSYDAQGNRIRKDQGNFASSQYKEYVWANGQVLAEKDQTGNWTDYIYANGKKVAKVAPTFNTLHTHGVRDGSISMGCGTNWNVAGAGGSGYVIKTGDRLLFSEKAINAKGGISFALDNGTYVDLLADDGMLVYEDTTPDGTWHSRSATLTPYQGRTLQYPVVTAQADTPAGTWDQWLANISIVSPDGTVTPILVSQTVSGSVWDACGGHDLAFGSEQDAPGADGPSMSTNYYIGDHLGTTQMEFSGGGWPVWKGEFSPFGQELDTEATSNNYKFTGKERDAETGLDYFGARYYGSNMGRWMSPDWADKPEAVPYSSLGDPQSLNLYGYVGNNPLSRADADGHYFVITNPHDQGFYQNALRDLYRRPGGRELVNSLANSDRPVLLDRRSLDTANTGLAGVTTAMTVSGQPGVAGAHVTVGTDADLMAGGKMAPGKVSSDVTTGHELEHANDGITAGQNSLQAGAAAMAAGDAPSTPGANNTVGGTAQSRAEGIMNEKTDMSKKDATSAVRGILKSGQQQWKDNEKKPQ